MLRFILAVGLLSTWPSFAVGQLPAASRASSAQRQPIDVTAPIDSWMKCSECTERELNAVVKLGPLAVPVLGQILRDGPPAQSSQAMRNLLLANYSRLKEFEKSHPKPKVPANEQEFVKIYMDNFDARNRVRAARALSRIGGSDARTFLEEAQRAPLRDDVRQAIRHELELINTPKP